VITIEFLITYGFQTFWQGKKKALSEDRALVPARVQPHCQPIPQQENLMKTPKRIDSLTISDGCEICNPSLLTDSSPSSPAVVPDNLKHLIASYLASDLLEARLLLQEFIDDLFVELLVDAVDETNTREMFDPAINNQFPNCERTPRAVVSRERSVAAAWELFTRFLEICAEVNIDLSAFSHKQARRPI